MKTPRWHWLVRQGALLLIYGVFIFFTGYYIHGLIKYHGVEHWPSVEAYKVKQTGGILQTTFHFRYSGRGNRHVDMRRVEFEYVVGQKTYRGSMATPNGGGLPVNTVERFVSVHYELEKAKPATVPDPNVVFGSWRAYYKPSDPSVAVLIPIPFHSSILILTIFLSGVFVGGHLYFEVLPRFH